jgi:hypothetical protein
MHKDFLLHNRAGNNFVIHDMTKIMKGEAQEPVANGTDMIENLLCLFFVPGCVNDYVK